MDFQNNPVVASDAPLGSALALLLNVRLGCRWNRLDFLLRLLVTNKKRFIKLATGLTILELTGKLIRTTQATSSNWRYDVLSTCHSINLPFCQLVIF